MDAVREQLFLIESFEGRVKIYQFDTIFMGNLVNDIVDSPDGLLLIPTPEELGDRGNLHDVERLVVLGSLKSVGLFPETPDQFLLIGLEDFEEIIVNLVYQIVRAEADDVGIGIPVHCPQILDGGHIW